MDGRKGAAHERAQRGCYCCCARCASCSLTSSEARDSDEQFLIDLAEDELADGVVDDAVLELLVAVVVRVQSAHRPVREVAERVRQRRVARRQRPHGRAVLLQNAVIQHTVKNKTTITRKK